MNSSNDNPDTGTDRTVDRMQRSLRRRYAAERRFRLYGLASILLALAFMLLLFIGIFGKGYTAFEQTRIRLSVDLASVEFPASVKDVDGFYAVNYAELIKHALYTLFPEASGRSEKRKLYQLISPGAVYILRDRIMAAPDMIGKAVDIWLPADDDVDMYVKGNFDTGDGTTGRLSKQQAGWVDALRKEGRLEKHFNTTFFTAGDSREPELAGIRGALMGSIFTHVERQPILWMYPSSPESSFTKCPTLMGLSMIS